MMFAEEIYLIPGPWLGGDRVFIYLHLPIMSMYLYIYGYTLNRFLHPYNIGVP